MYGDESQLRHPAERPLFLLFVVVNLLLMAATIYIVFAGSNWLKAHPRLAKHRNRIRALAVAAIIALPATVFLRNTRHALIRGQSIAISPRQLPELYAILERHCQKLGMDPLPELYYSDMKMSKPVRAYTAWKCDYIVLSTKFLQPDLRPMLALFAFWIGRELGSLRLNHASWSTELLLAYVDKIPHLSNPLRLVFAYSEDRYGAFLAPEGLAGLTGIASGRLMLPGVNTAEYVNDVRAYHGLWAKLAEITQAEPPVAHRINALFDAGLLKHEGPSAGEDPG